MQTRLDRYVALLYKWNRRLRLVGERDPAVFRARHLAEMIEVLPHLGGFDWSVGVDIGSGNGLLAIPIALAFPGRKVVALEPRTLKCAFLRACQRELELANLDPRPEKLEDFRPDPAAALLWAARAIEISPSVLLRAVLAQPGHLLMFTARRSPSWQLLQDGADRLELLVEHRFPGKGQRAAIIARLRP